MTASPPLLMICLDSGKAKSTSKGTDRSVRPTQDDFGVEQGAGDASGDGDEVALAEENLDLPGAGEFGEIDGASATDAGGGGFIGGDGGELGE